MKMFTRSNQISARNVIGIIYYNLERVCMMRALLGNGYGSSLRKVIRVFACADLGSQLQLAMLYVSKS